MLKIDYLLTNNKEHKIVIENESEKFKAVFYKESNIGNLTVNQSGEDFFCVFNLDKLDKLIEILTTLKHGIKDKEVTYIEMISNIIYGEDNND